MLRAALWAAPLYALLALASHRTLLPAIGTHVYAQNVPGNDCLLHVWTLAWDRHALATDPAGVCDANIFTPYPDTLLYSDHLLGLAVLLTPLQLVTTNPVLLHNLATIAAPALDALALFALAWELTGNPIAAFVGGVLYGFAPLRLETDRCQIQMLVAWWLPLAMLFVRRALLRNSVVAAVLAGVCLAFQGMTGIYLFAFFLPILGLAQLTWMRRYPYRTHRRGWHALLLAEAAAALAQIPMALAYRGVQQSLGISRPAVLNALLSLSNADVFPQFPVWTFAVLCTIAVLGRRDGTPFRSERWLFTGLTVVAFLFAFGPAVPLPGDLGQIRGPYAALLALPGFTALRAPGRFIHIALLTMSVLAAGGIAVLWASFPRRLAVVLTAAALGLGLWEHGLPQGKLHPAPPPALLDPTYAWLARQPDDMRLMEFPLDDFTIAATKYQYASTAHWKRIAVGNMGILPPLYPWLASSMARFPDPDVRATLQQLGITHVVSHLPDDLQQHLTAPETLSRARLRTVFASPRSTVLELLPMPPAPPLVVPGTPLDRSTWTATASESPSTARDGIDDDPTATWNSWGDLEVAVHRWYDAVPFLVHWQRYLKAQPTRFAIDLGHVARVTGLTMRLGGSDPLVAPALVFETSVDGVTWEPLDGHLAPLPDARTFIQQGPDARFAVVAKAPVSARHVRLTCNGLEWHLDDVQVHAE